MEKPPLKVDWCSHKAALYACRNWHYSKSMPTPPVIKIGIWEGDTYKGCILFSRGNAPSIGKPYGLKQTQVCELTRIALKDHFWPVSKMIAEAFRLLKKHSPMLLIVSFADPSENHHGGIYQATNWIYTGKTSPTSEYIGPDGKRVHSRMTSKSGYTKVYGEYRRVLKPEQCTKIRKPGKHKYLFALDKSLRKKLLKLSKPYPKRESVEV
jgi:hypothetical protein